MTDEPELAVLREALRQGERVLTFQDQARESLLRRASDLLKLSVATIGGVIIVGGLLSTTQVQADLLFFIWFSAGVGLLVLSTGVLAAALADVKAPGAFTQGPDPGRIAPQIRQPETTEAGLLIALVDAQPEWVGDNGQMLDRLQRRIAWSLVLLAMGTLLLLITLFFIVGGAILA